VKPYHLFVPNTAYKGAFDPASFSLIKIAWIDLGRFAVDLFYGMARPSVRRSRSAAGLTGGLDHGE
jgi:hypothetical protein